MEVTSIASLASSISNSRANEAVGMLVLKKALDAQSSGAQALIEAIPAAPSANLPSHLGQNVNTTA